MLNRKEMTMDMKDTIEKLEKKILPYDLDDLIRKGILSKKGGWYTLERPDDIPDHVLSHATELRTETNKKAKFKIEPFSEKNQKTYQKLLEQLKKS